MLRIIKLIRIVRASRIISRWQNHISVPFALISLIKFIALTVRYSSYHVDLCICPLGAMGTGIRTHTSSLTIYWNYFPTSSYLPIFL